MPEALRQTDPYVLTVFLFRHAKSDWSDPTLPDDQRPLANRGRRDAGLLAVHLGEAHIGPELILCSPARRTRETLELAFGQTDVRVEFDPVLYAASAATLLDRLRDTPDTVSSVMLIGHNPGLHDLALLLVDSGKKRTQLEAKFPTGALATITAPAGTWRDLGRVPGVLSEYVTPATLRG